jgi:hypothetical protein
MRKISLWLKDGGSDRHATASLVALADAAQNPVVLTDEQLDHVSGADRKCPLSVAARSTRPSSSFRASGDGRRRR